jgi:hypothetical protein
MADKKMPNIGSDRKATSYPDPSLAGRIGEMSDSGLGPTNMNAANYVADPDVLNASPATKKSYSWNKGETGNAT